MDFRRFLETVWRYKAIVAAAAAVGLLAGVAYMFVRPPLVTSTALVVLPGGSRYIQTQALIASSNPVLISADRAIRPALPLATLRKRVSVTSLTSDVLAINGRGESAAQAEDVANAVANSYLAYVSSPSSPVGVLNGRMLEKATVASGTGLRERILAAVVGLLLGLVTGAIIALGLSRADKRLRHRDEIADAIGIPVLASIPVQRPSDPAGWARLLEGYEPDVVHAWSLRKALRHLDLTDYRGGGKSGESLTVLTLAADRKALALGPQLAAFAASLGMRTALVIDSGQDADATATLCAACRTTSAAPSGRRANMQVSVAAEEDADRHLRPNALTVVVAVVEGKSPRLTGLLRTTATVLGVSAGAATAEQLARVALSAVADEREIAGILIADPDPTDATTGRFPQPVRPAEHRRPTRMPGSTMDAGL